MLNIKVTRWVFASIWEGANSLEDLQNVVRDEGGNRVSKEELLRKAAFLRAHDIPMRRFDGNYSPEEFRENKELNCIAEEFAKKYPPTSGQK